MAANPTPPPEATLRAPLRLIAVGTALLILLLLVTNFAVILHLRTTALLGEENRLKSFSLILADQADRSFQSVDLVISSVAEGLAAEGVSDSASFDQKLVGHDIHLFLREKISGLPQLASVTVISSDGKLLNFSRSWPIPELDVSDRRYFQALKNDANMKSYISEPVQNRATGTWTIFLAHRVSGANGEFLGIILGAIEMRYFEDFYRIISGQSGGSLALVRLDGVTLTRFPRTDTIGQVFSKAKRMLGGGDSGTLREPSPIDGRMSIKAAHRLASYPLFVIAAKSEHAALAAWRSIAWLMSVSTFGCAIAIATAGFAFGRQWKHRAKLSDSQAELGRQEERAAAMRAAAEVAQTTALEMTRSSEHDFLTGLPNRLLLNDRIGQAIAAAKRHKKTLAVLVLDLDGFKHINDSLGHAIGDKLLQSIAERLVKCVRASDTVSRQGGDEFVVLLSEVEQSGDAVIAARRIVEAVTGPHSIDEHELHVRAAIAAKRMLQAVAGAHSIDRHDLYITASIGVSVYPNDGGNPETLIQHADTAMYQAKENGRQSYQFFKPDMNDRAVERQSIEEGLRRALERREFTLHYQPIMDLATGAITGAEALIRWTHPTRGMIPPLQFIPVAEDCGLMLPIGKWVLREACRQTQAWVEEGFPMRTIAVNVSALEFRDENFLQNLLAILGETGLHPRLLELELTESVLMKRPEAAASILHSLREKGVRVAIDDFGTGYSSLGYLQKFPLDVLKIDQSFLRQIGTPGADTSIVTAVIAMAQGLKLWVIAEGIETLEQLEFLRAHRCDAAQGYYFSRPLPPEQFAKLLRNGIPDVTTGHSVRSEPRTTEVAGA